MNRSFVIVCAMLLVAIGMTIGCKEEPPATEYTLSELEYLVLDSFDDVFWCDPDFYPVAREGQEEKNALERFLDIRADAAEFLAILQRLGLPDKSAYTDEEKLLIYREHKKLTYQIEMTATGDNYQFTLRVTEGQGERIEGTVTSSGKIRIVKREPSFNTCPICLAKGTLIDTPGGQVPVEQLSEGMMVWTVDGTGNRVSAVVLRTTRVLVSSSVQLVKVTLSDGRFVIVSSRHPTAEGRALSDYQVGDALSGAVVVAIEHLTYSDGFTYDLLPSGVTGLYWANGVLLKSTIVTK
ncbi:MAG: Hint domain-containing protein [Chloroflexota bacterium]